MTYDVPPDRGIPVATSEFRPFLIFDLLWGRLGEMRFLLFWTGELRHHVSTYLCILHICFVLPRSPVRPSQHQAKRHTCFSAREISKHHELAVGFASQPTAPPAYESFQGPDQSPKRCALVRLWVLAAIPKHTKFN